MGRVDQSIFVCTLAGRIARGLISDPVIYLPVPGQNGDPLKSTRQLHELGQSLWLDNISRTLLEDGTLARYIAKDTPRKHCPWSIFVLPRCLLRWHRRSRSHSAAV